MTKVIGLLALVVGLSMSGPASAHFSQVFGPFKALMMSESALQASAKSFCVGRYAALISPDGILSLD
jgi:hypothetical protein